MLFHVDMPSKPLPVWVICQMSKFQIRVKPGHFTRINFPVKINSAKQSYFFPPPNSIK